MFEGEECLYSKNVSHDAGELEKFASLSEQLPYRRDMILSSVSYTHLSNQERVSLNAFKGIGSGLIQMVISAVTMPMILHFGNGSASSSRGYFMAALVFSIVCVPCFWVCFASAKEIIGRKDDAKKETIGDRCV